MQKHEQSIHRRLIFRFCLSRSFEKQVNKKHDFFIFQVDYPEIAETVTPRHRFMSAYEQRIEPPDKAWQYLLFAAEPYETIAFKVCIAFTA